MIDISKWSFAVGHVFNDLCASMWFLFTLPYFTKVLRLENAIAGDIVLIGQICDALSTPLIGIESDRKGFICGSRIGNRKSWHLLGTVLTVVSFPFIFTSFFKPESTIEWYLVVWYTPFVAIFQFAWATVQVTHLSLIPIMVQEGQDNSTLNSLRYIFTIIANVVVLVSTTLLFTYLSHNSESSTNQTVINPSSLTLNPSDQWTFTYLSLGIVVIGIFFSLIFQLGVHERRNMPNEEDSEDQNKATEMTSLARPTSMQMSKMDWFKEPQFYLINLTYLSSRLIVNISQMYLVIYVIDTLGLPKIDGSLAALTTFISGAIASIILRRLQQRIGKKICFLVGLLFITAYCIMVSFSFFGNPSWRMYLSMAILGVGCSVVMIGSLSLTADLIGDSCSSSAFVYGCMSFSDKLSSGLVIWFLQRFGPVKQECRACQSFYRNIQLYFIGGCCAFALVIILILFPLKIGIRRRDRNVLVNTNHAKSGSVSEST